MATILIIDDEVMTVQMLTALLKIIGHDSIGANTATQALSMLQSTTPDAILLDIMLPDVNGLQLCYELRANPRIMHTPILMISATAPPLIEEAKAAGASGYLVKPLTLNDIRAALATSGVFSP